MIKNDLIGEEIAYPNGDLYIGASIDNKRDGFGVYTSHLGEKYIGNFKRDSRNGLGLQIFNDSEEFFELGFSLVFGLSLAEKFPPISAISGKSTPFRGTKYQNGVGKV